MKYKINEISQSHYIPDSSICKIINEDRPIYVDEIKDIHYGSKHSGFCVKDQHFDNHEIQPPQILLTNQKIIAKSMLILEFKE